MQTWLWNGMKIIEKENTGIFPLNEACFVLCGHIELKDGLAENF